MPWVPEFFTAPALQQLADERRHEELVTVPYVDGLLIGEPEALVRSFAGEPMVHDPVRGRVRGARAFTAFATHMHDWLLQRHVAVEEISHRAFDRGGFGEAVLHLDGARGEVALPLVIVSDRAPDGRIEELRVYHSTLPLTGHHGSRPPLLQPDHVRLPDVMAEHQRALAAGDVDAAAGAFEPSGHLREAAAGDQRVHTGPDGVRARYEELLSEGGIAVEHCSTVGDDGICALEYNITRWGREDVLPQAGAAVYVQGQSGRLAALRVYDDVAPPPGISRG
jgi:hypothetical protein